MSRFNLDSLSTRSRLALDLTSNLLRRVNAVEKGACIHPFLARDLQFEDAYGAFAAGDGDIFIADC